MIKKRDKYYKTSKSSKYVRDDKKKYISVKCSLRKRTKERWGRTQPNGLTQPNSYCVGKLNEFVGWNI